jgi:vacuolar-type H+-ATPase subunit E/Vma4
MTGPGTNRSDSSYASGGSGAAGRQAENLGERAREKASELKHQAEEAAHGLRDRARSMVDRQKHAAAGRVEGVASALRTASDELREQGQPMIAEYSQYAAEGLEGMAQSLDRRDIDDFVEGVEQFARERPIVFLGGAMIAGFALARFMKSSSARRYRRADRSGEARPATAGMAASPAGATTTPGTWTSDPGTPGAAG